MSAKASFLIELKNYYSGVSRFWKIYIITALFIGLPMTLVLDWLGKMYKFRIGTIYVVIVILGISKLIEVLTKKKV